MKTVAMPWRIRVLSHCKRNGIILQKLMIDQIAWMWQDVLS